MFFRQLTVGQVTERCDINHFAIHGAYRELDGKDNTGTRLCDELKALSKDWTDTRLAEVGHSGKVPCTMLLGNNHLV